MRALWFVLAHGVNALAPAAWTAPVWNVALNVGREGGSSMPADWAANGARFFSQCKIEFCDAPGDASEPFLGATAAAMGLPKRDVRLAKVVEPISYTDVGGKRTVDVGDGAWVLAQDRDPYVLRFWLDLSAAKDVTSRGVALPAEKIYFTAAAFDADAQTEARKELLPLKQALRAAEAEVDAFEATPSPLSILALAKKTEARDAAQAALARLEARLPKGDPAAGSLPGSDRVMVDTGSLSVRRKGRLPWQGDTYAVVGRWTATPVLEGAELAASKRLYY
mmetsp:Transcript_27307/g.81913  ORF Transcript_27307/g.81913 Transcript_27307/m.81913 type:complete len:279 (+) Transcript_27307:144-980(+)